MLVMLLMVQQASFWMFCLGCFSRLTNKGRTWASITVWERRGKQQQLEAYMYSTGEISLARRLVMLVMLLMVQQASFWMFCLGCFSRLTNKGRTWASITVWERRGKQQQLEAYMYSTGEISLARRLVMLVMLLMVQQASFWMFCLGCFSRLTNKGRTWA